MMNNNRTFLGVIISLTGALLIMFAFIVIATYELPAYWNIIILYLLLNATIFAAVQLTVNDKCIGSELVEGCGKTLYPVKWYGIFFMMMPFNKIGRNNHKFFGYIITHKVGNEFKGSWGYSCKACEEKHDSIVVMNELTKDEQEPIQRPIKYY